ncbi:hypothetical protein TIFTF001_006876 [Ficus carica]|uniref:Uncharacterized protein n=1 Tax=Ficus carica TaxID=3494 RepID=A0AA88CWG6_FICCA|nr:hypothetical protein TIFTF001_006876 [Ficus carica]
MKMACLRVRNRNHGEGWKSRAVVDNDILPAWIMFSLRFHWVHDFHRRETEVGKDLSRLHDQRSRGSHCRVILIPSWPTCASCLRISRFLLHRHD